jgi:hypothetical protein
MTYNNIFFLGICIHAIILFSFGNNIAVYASDTLEGDDQHGICSTSSDSSSCSSSEMNGDENNRKRELYYGLSESDLLRLTKQAESDLRIYIYRPPKNSTLPHSELGFDYTGRLYFID